MNINLITEEQGYCKDQVDSYIEKLSTEYKEMYDDFMLLTRQYDELRFETKILDEAAACVRAQNAVLEKTVETLNGIVNETRDRVRDEDREAIAQALINAQIFSKQLISQAKIRAAKIEAEAYEELSPLQEEKIA